MRSDDLLASVFPDVAACQENIEGDIKIPDHPLVREVMKDVLTEALDIDGLAECCAASSEGAFAASLSILRCRRNSRTRFSMRIRTRISTMRRSKNAGRERSRCGGCCRSRCSKKSALSIPAAIAQVQQEAWPDVRDADELHDVLHTLVMMPAGSQLSAPSFQQHQAAAHWRSLFERLQNENRAVVAEAGGRHGLGCRGNRAAWFYACFLLSSQMRSARESTPTSTTPC